MKNRLHALLAVSVTALLFALGPVAAHDRDPADSNRVQGRLDRETQKINERNTERDARYAEERAKIESRAAEDPVKAAEDLAKLDADTAKETTKANEDLAKAEADYQEDAAKEAEDLAEDASRVDNSGHGSSAEIADLGSDESAEHDGQGFAVKRGELVALDLSADTIRAAEAKGFKIISRERLDQLNREVIHLAVPEGMTATDARSRLRDLAPDATIDLVHYYGLSMTAGSRPRTARNGAMPSRSRAPLTVGLIDTAVAQHPALTNARMVAWPAGASSGAPTEHGTAVASLLASEGRPTIYAANIFRGPADRPFTSADVIAKALEWMMANGVQTINMSLAGPRNALLDRLIRDALAHGYVVIAAAGNGGPTAPPSYPAAVRGVIAVTAVDRNNRVYRYANRGRYIAVAASGVDVVAARSGGGFARFSGTSFATPHIAGWFARCRTSGATARDCRTRLYSTARDLGSAGYDEIYGFGLID